MPSKDSSKRRFRVIGTMTISVHAVVEAKDESEARELAEDLGVQSFCYQCSSGDQEEWSTTGELDGEPRIESVEEVESE